MEKKLQLTESEVLRVLLALNYFRKKSPTAEFLIKEIEKQTGVEL